MSARGKWLLVLVGLAAAWAGLQFGRWQLGDELNSGAPAPDGAAIAQLLAAPLKTAKGRNTSLAEWRGKVLVVNFWATWCPPCREEMPVFSKMQNALGARGVQFVGLAIDDAANVAEFARKTPVSYPLFIAPPETPGLMAALGNAPQGLPFTIVIDRDGKPVFQHLGPLTEAQLREKLASVP